MFISVLEPLADKKTVPTQNGATCSGFGKGIIAGLHMQERDLQEQAMRKTWCEERTHRFDEQNQHASL